MEKSLLLLLWLIITDYKIIFYITGINKNYLAKRHKISLYMYITNFLYTHIYIYINNKNIEIKIKKKYLLLLLVNINALFILLFISIRKNILFCISYH